MTPVFDTNILIDYLNGAPQAADELARYASIAISAITWIEVMTGAKNVDEEHILRSFLKRFQLISITMTVAEIAFSLRRTHRMRLPDALIWATARAQNTLLITRNTKDFSEQEVDIRVPYHL